MIKEQLYNKTVQILFDAYFNDELQHASCSACAVANLILAAHHLKPVKDENIFMWPHNAKSYTYDGLGWYDVVVCKTQPTAQVIEQLIEPTGYSVETLAIIEKAFEEADKGKSEEDWMFNGLVAVLEVLKKIHKVKDNSEVKQKFNNHYQSLK